jgi:pimeloyl-ACP methyl ester carboxylesterase
VAVAPRPGEETLARFVLIHGAWHGGWCWAGVVEALEARGHVAWAPDLPCEQVGLTQRDYAEVIGPQPDAIVVGHSWGAQTAGLVDTPVRVYLAGTLPVDDLFPDCFAPDFGGTVRDELDRSYWPDADTCAQKLYPDCTREVSDRAFAQLRRQARTAEVTVPLRPDDVVIATMHDRAIDPGWQVRMSETHGTRLVRIAAGHSPFLTQPDELAGVLSSLG